MFISLKSLFVCAIAPFGIVYFSYLLHGISTEVEAKDNFEQNVNNSTTVSSRVFNTMIGGGYNPWQQIPSQEETEVHVKSSAEEITKERVNYVPDTLPVVSFDDQKNIILNIFCVRGNDNRILDAGKGKVCAQILAPHYESAFEAELHRYLTGVFQVRREDINITKTGMEHERKVIVAGKSVTSDIVVERLLDVLESPI